MYRLILILTCIVCTCTFIKKEDDVLIANLQSNRLLRNYVRNEKISGEIGANFYTRTKSDSLVFLHISKPEEQTYPIDSIYFLYYKDNNNFKLLAQSEFEKGLIYLEVDKNGSHKKKYTFGGYVLKVNNLKIQDMKSGIQLTFDTYIWASTMPDTLKQFIKIESDKNSIDFKMWNKFNKKDNWTAISLD
jgi:hypothetical protein